MCITPNKLADGQLVACRECWQCAGHKITDWVGRCIAESRTSKACHSITLTYGRDADGNEDHERARVLTYSDVQKYLKYLRIDGYPVRYFVAGEYGSRKGRAHWHLIAFWQDKVPPHELNKRFNQKHWPHGFSFWEDMQGGDGLEVAPARYVCKYILKEKFNDEQQTHVAMSKKPPLGSAYFAGLADRYVAQGLVPQNLDYRFAGAVDANGKPIQFQLGGKSAELFLDRILEGWGDRVRPGSELVDDYEDLKKRKEYEARIAQELADGKPENADYEFHRNRRQLRRQAEKPWFYPALYSERALRFDEKMNAFFILVHGTFGEWAGAHQGDSPSSGERLYWSFDKEGNRAWESVLRTESETGIGLKLHTYRNQSQGA